MVAKATAHLSVDFQTLPPVFAAINYRAISAGSNVAPCPCAKLWSHIFHEATLPGASVVAAGTCQFCCEGCKAFVLNSCTRPLRGCATHTCKRVGRCCAEPLVFSLVTGCSGALIITRVCDAVGVCRALVVTCGSNADAFFAAPTVGNTCGILA